MNRRMFLSLAGVLAVTGRALAVHDPKPVVRDPMPVATKPIGKTKPLKFDGFVKFDPDHRCDNCGHQSAAGTGTWVQSSDLGDRHVHTCPNCKTQWWHFDDGHVPSTQTSNPFTLPSSGCANGQCPTGSAPSRFRIFRR